MPSIRLILLVLALPILSACSPPPPPPVQDQALPIGPSQTQPVQRLEAPETPEPTNSPVAPPVPSKTPTPAPERVAVCSPLEGILLSELGNFMTNPFNPPVAGSDDPHQGIDLADFLPGTRVAIKGRGVAAIMGGRVAAVLNGDFPFGYGVILETAWSGTAENVPLLPTPFPDTPLYTTLSCPAVTRFDVNQDARSVYVMYAHLDGPVDIDVGEQVDCGQVIGRIGDSGNALNPHVHVEVRAGPSRLTLVDGMSHYDPSATAAEMDAYCLWRVDGSFQLLDPADLFGVDEE